MQHGPASLSSSSETDEFAAIYAAFSSSLRVSDLPAHVTDAARANLLDTLACAVAGCNAPGVADVSALAQSWGGAPQAAIWCSDARVPAHHAAWVNGMMAHARDYDDTHDAAILHAGVSVVPAALAAAELRPEATGADLLAGVVAGLELVCRLGMATTIGIIESGFIYTSLFGYFGATAAAARVMGLDARQTVNALGIAYSQAAGTHQVTRDAALTKRMQPGFAAKAALMSVQLAQREIRGAQNVFDGVDGLFRTYLRGGYDPKALRAGLGTRFEMTALSYKPYPCCRFNHLHRRGVGHRAPARLRCGAHRPHRRGRQ
jgi:2-methylcitrate dehydratase PrpD